VHTLTRLDVANDLEGVHVNDADIIAAAAADIEPQVFLGKAWCGHEHDTRAQNNSSEIRARSHLVYLPFRIQSRKARLPDLIIFALQGLNQAESRMKVFSGCSAAMMLLALQSVLRRWISAMVRFEML
jgi:hypothetical protein